MNETTTLFDEIEALLEADLGGDLEQLERTLTDGYARALALEAERLRIEKRIGEVAGRIGSGDSTDHAPELATLAQRLAGADEELARLRGVLGDLRRRADVVRATAGSETA